MIVSYWIKILKVVKNFMKHSINSILQIPILSSNTFKDKFFYLLLDNSSKFILILILMSVLIF